MTINFGRFIGITGLQGSTGAQGSTGVQGLTGFRGSTGPQGLTGVHGLTGAQGVTGLNGLTGFQGLTGVQGLTGIQGLTGLSLGQTGIRGVTGLVGVTGINGITGLQGLTGLSGGLDDTIVEATGSITTTSATYVLATSMALTPVSGTYVVWFSGSAGNSASNTTTSAAIYFGGTQVASSIRTITRVNQTNHRIPFCCVAVVTVNGSQAIEGRWLVTSGTGTMVERNLLIVKAG